MTEFAFMYTDLLLFNTDLLLFNKLFTLRLYVGTFVE